MCAGVGGGVMASKYKVTWKILAINHSYKAKTVFPVHNENHKLNVSLSDEP